VLVDVHQRRLRAQLAVRHLRRGAAPPDWPVLRKYVRLALGRLKDRSYSVSSKEFRRIKWKSGIMGVAVMAEMAKKGRAQV
jgi:hypothetical protein